MIMQRSSIISKSDQPSLNPALSPLLAWAGSVWLSVRTVGVMQPQPQHDRLWQLPQRRKPLDLGGFLRFRFSRPPATTRTILERSWKYRGRVFEFQFSPELVDPPCM